MKVPYFAMPISYGLNSTQSAGSDIVIHIKETNNYYRNTTAARSFALGPSVGADIQRPQSSKYYFTNRNQSIKRLVLMEDNYEVDRLASDQFSFINSISTHNQMSVNRLFVSNC